MNPFLNLNFQYLSDYLIQYVLIGNYTRSTTALSQCNCFQECETSSYEVSVSSALYPAQHIVDDIKTTMNVTEEYIR